MYKLTLALVGTMAAILAGVLPATVAAHGPGDMPMGVGMSMHDPLVMHGNAQVSIIHQQVGCHSWSTGNGASATGVKAIMKPGQHLVVVNKDIDTHKFVRLAGPRLALGKPVSMNHRAVLTFKTPGVYKLRTKTVETPGMPEVETMGADHVLALVVIVR